jgi:6-phosphogluconolactonase
MTESGGHKVSNGGENDVVVWAIDQSTGEPTLIQRAWTDSYELRTFSMDPSGKVLIAASTTPMPVMDQGVLSTVSAGLSIYKVGADGKLASAGKVDVDTSAGVQFWAGMLTMA